MGILTKAIPKQKMLKKTSVLIAKDFEAYCTELTTAEVAKYLSGFIPVIF